jgi:nitrogen regulatory protein P-II 1
MKKIEAIIRPERLELVKDALNKHEIKGLTITQVMGCGNQKGKLGTYRGSVVDLTLLPKIKIEVVCADENAKELIGIISEAAKTGAIGDGKIFVFNAEDVVRIRTGESGEAAI